MARNVDVLKIQTKLTDIIEFLHPWKELTTCHLVDFFTKDLWANLIPDHIKKEVNGNNFINFRDIFLQIIKYKADLSNPYFKNTIEFFNRSNKLSLRKDLSCCLSLDELREKLDVDGFELQNSVKLRNYMSEKKNHEVEVMSEIVAMLSRLHGTTYIVDIGGGKGYLSSILSLFYQLKVLGVDASQVTTCGAVKRLDNISKHWSGAVIQDTTCEDKTKQVRQLVNNLYKQATCYVDQNANVSQLMEEHFNEEVDRLGLIGLHTCGNLASTCLKMFPVNPKVAYLVNIGCCYHLIEEQYYRNPFWKDLELVVHEDEYGFPMSEFLKGQSYQLGRNARMVAAHNIDKFSDQSQFSTKSIYFRALLQVLLERHKGHTFRDGQVGRLATKCSTFADYIKKASIKMHLDFEFSSSEVEEILEEHASREYQLEAFYLLRTALSQLVEAIILLDRLLFLHEQGFPNSYLVPMFHAATSPRCFGIVAWK